MTDSAIAALRELAMPVVVVGARDEAGPCAATATAMYTSLDPVQVVVSLATASRTGKAALASGELSVSVLGGDQEEIAVRVARHSDVPDKFADLGIQTTSVDGFAAPALAGVTACWGRVVDTVPTGDHVLVLLRVEHVQLASGADSASGALIRLGRSYTSAHPGATPADEPYPL